MTKFKNKYHVESIRLKEWDYSTPWWYYVTINTKGHKEYFGNIANGEIQLNDFGKMVKREWVKSKQIRKNIDLDYFVIMPNHIHGIIIINEFNDSRCHTGRDVRQNVSTDMHLRQDIIVVGDIQQNVSDTVAENQENENSAVNKNEFFSKISPKSNSLSVIIRGFKASVTKFAHMNGINEFQWQSRFYDRIIRNEDGLYSIRKNIERNPLNWEMEKKEYQNLW